MIDCILSTGLTLRAQRQGPKDGPAIVFAHGLGTDLTIWDAVIPHLPDGLHVIRYDLRGHGASDCPAPPYSMGALVRDTEELLEQLGLSDCIFVGLGLGGMIAQGLAVKRLDLVRALVLSGTAAKLGQPNSWRTRGQQVLTQGMTGVADDIVSRWFSRDALARGLAEPIRNSLLAMNPDGYAGGCHAIAGTDFYTPTSGLRLPTLGLAGREDRVTPPDLQRETVELIPGAQFRLLRRAGHLPCVDNAEAFAAALTEFMHEIGHI